MSNHTEIQAMLTKVREEKAQLEKRLDILEQREETLLEWLKEEAPKQPDLPAISTGVNGGSPLSSFLRGVLADGKPHFLPELSGLAQAKGGLVKEDAAPGRVIHFALLGMAQHGQVERRKDGAWVKVME